MKLSVKHIEPDEIKGPDIVLIHGTGSSSEMWDQQVEPLKKMGHRLWLLDLRGHGKSDEPGGRANLETHIGDVLDTIDSLDTTPSCVYLGHSLGSIISTNIAARHGELVDRLLLAAMPCRIIPGVAQAFKLFLGGPFKMIRGTALHEKLPWREKTLLSTSPHTLAEIVDNFKGVDFLAESLNLDCPVHFASGRFDPVAPCHYVVRLHKSMPGSTLQIFELAGHNFMDYNSQAFNAWIASRLED